MNDPLVVRNNTEEIIQILNTSINPQTTYTLLPDEFSPWAKDGKLRFMIESGQCTVILYGVILDPNTATRWLSHISLGDIVIT